MPAASPATTSSARTSPSAAQIGTDPEVSGITQGEVDIRRPLISSFDLFSDPQSPDDGAGPFSLYKHPLDPGTALQSPLAAMPTQDL